MLAILLLLGLQGPAWAQTALRLTTTVHNNPTFTFGGRSGPWIEAVIHYEGGPCPAQLPPMPGAFSLLLEGAPINTHAPYLAFSRSCLDGTYTAGYDFEIPRDLDFGSHTFTVEYSGGDGFLGAVSQPLTFTIVPPVTAWSGGGQVSVGTSAYSAYSCRSQQLAIVPQASTPAPPPGYRFPYGALSYDLQGCYFECGFLCPPGTPNTPTQRLLAEFPQALPRDASLLQFDGTGWRRMVDSSIEGDLVRALISGAPGSGNIVGMLAVALPETATVPMHDLWWAGESESGWGVSIAQNGNRLFVVLFIYDEQGRPQWVVLPNGQWTSPGVWEGELYRPSGAWHPDHDGSRLRMGPAVGTARIASTGPMTAQMDYKIDGVSGGKQIRRQVFAPQGSAMPGPYAGLWWGGPAESGWGIHIAHQEETLFAVWYTYDAQGRGTWYVMPGGRWNAANRYSGTLYRASGSPWVGARYDPGRLVLAPVGTLAFEFSAGGTASMEYLLEGRSGTESLTRQPF